MKRKLHECLNDEDKAVLLLKLLEANRPTYEETMQLSKEAEENLSRVVIRPTKLNTRLSESRKIKNGIISTGKSFA